MNEIEVPNTGQVWARTRWNSHRSGAAFDRKKQPYLAPEMKVFAESQDFCIVSFLNNDGQVCGRLLHGRLGEFAKARDGHHLIIQPLNWTMVDLAFRKESTLLRSLSGQAPEPFWVGNVEAETFANLVADLFWLLAEPDRQGVLALADYLGGEDWWDKHRLGHGVVTTVASLHRRCLFRKSPGLPLPARASTLGRRRNNRLQQNL